jgi:hypothetical protein
MRVSLFSLCLAATSAVAFLTSCGDSEDPAPKPEGTNVDRSKPPMQKAISLFTKNERPLGTRFRNSATLTMENANLVTRRGEETVNGKVTTIMRDLWEVNQISPTERDFTIEEMSLTNETTIARQPKKDRTESTLAGYVFKVTRADESSAWKVAPPEQTLTHLQEIDLKMLGNLWDEASESLYPEEQLEIGQTWQADPKAFGMIVSPRLKVEEGKVTCRLDEITVLRGERCGSISVDIDITGRFEMSGGTGMQVQIALTGTIMRSLYKFYDMRTELKGSMQMEMEFPDRDTTISIDGVAEFLQLADLSEPEEVDETEEPEDSPETETEAS